MAMDRRTFVLGTALGAAAAARVWGANDRLRIGILGPGAHGRGLLRGLLTLADEANAEVAAVCDLWTKRRDEAAAQVKESSGREPKRVARYADLLALEDLDGVMIATPDHQHATQLMEGLRAGKDVFCEKPMANDLAEAKAAYKAVMASTRVVQLGTQALSLPRVPAAAELVRSGRLGRITRVTQHAGFNGPRWRPVAAVSEIREQDTDWKAWLMGKPDRPFDPHLYFEFRLYREFSNGIPNQWMTHAVAEVHAVMDDYFPESVVASGGVLLYKDGRETSDTFQATFTYPRGFLFDYAAMFGNDYPGHMRYYGQNGTIERTESGSYKVLGTGGGSREERVKEEIELGAEKAPGHIRNWLDCMRSRRTPNADVRSGFAHSVASMMAARAEITGRRIYWDAKREEIVEQPPV